jgi:hypothetical protein
MLISNKFNGYVAGRRTYRTGMEPILIGAAVGGISSAAQGGDPLKGALLGGVTGGVGGAISGALPAVLGSATSAAAPAAASVVAPAATGAATGLGEAASGLSGAIATPINMGAVSSMPLQGIDELAGLGAQAPAVAPSTTSLAPSAMGQPTASTLPSVGQAPAGFKSNFGAFNPAAQQQPRGLMDIWNSLSPEKKMLYGGVGGLGLLSMMERKKVPGQSPYTGPLSKFKYDPMVYRPQFAKGGIADLGAYSDGGRLLKGPGDGMSDHIPATIAQKQPARLADGEFVVPADVVSHLGNGSTDAGAKQLYAMMDRVRAARTGNKKQGRKINPKKLIPA